MKPLVRRALSLAACLVLVACGSMPRGAALQKEVVQNADAEQSAFQLVEVTRAAVPTLAQWPVTGWHGHYHWIETSRGPQANTIRTGDRLDLTIWDNQVNSLITGPNTNVVEMNGMSVSPSGAIFVPYVGEVNVRGLAPADARRRIQEKLAPIAPDAQVQLSMIEGSQNSVSFVAGVGAPGSYALPDQNTTILSGLALAGGVSSTLRNPIVTLVRGSKTYAIPADTLFATARKNTRLRGGDKIVIEEDTRSFTALGASGVEDIIYFPKEKVSAIEALSLMGGINDQRADPQGVLILREYGADALHKTALGPTNTQVVFAIDLTSAEGLFAARKFDVHPGDTVLATESPVTAVSTVFRLVGQLFGLSTQVQGVAN